MDTQGISVSVHGASAHPIRPGGHVGIYIIAGGKRVITDSSGEVSLEELDEVVRQNVSGEHYNAWRAEMDSA